ncbi:MAG: DMT family transporter [Gemmatimonadales bacterium]|nr:DMT family transporter [Gemmatimonadales bacterium]
MDHPFLFYGETMAILAAVIFSWTSIFFTTAGQRLGVTTVNLLRLPSGALCLLLSHLVLTGRIWPEGMAWSQQMWIGLSGVVGLAIGDSALFKAFTTIGPRRSMAVMALAPVFTVILAWSLLDEHLSLWAMAGIVIVIGGVVMASIGKAEGSGIFGTIDPRILRTGLLLALIASAGQGLGSAFAKLGMTGSTPAGMDAPQIEGVDPLGATLVRMVWAAVAYWLVVFPRQDVRRLARSLNDPKGVGALVIAILMGPFISVWISVVAIKNTEAGIAQVLLGMVPIFVILPAWIVYRDKPSLRSIIGIIVAIGGGALLFLR